ncbi:hypothetical protein Golomagni_04430 [Golovinomyces magnicellulatus]|nr:hypothetical protein Golomagni_04430 [Golovinomyces magnicellulatus]
MSSLKKDIIKKSFKAYGIWTMDANQILKKFTHTPPESNRNRRSSSRLSPELERLAWAFLKNTHQEESKKLSLLLYQLSVLNQLLRQENTSLKEALNTKKKRKRYGKALDFEHSKKDHCGVIFYSPRAVPVARDIAEIKQRQEEKQLQKLCRKQEKKKARLLKQLKKKKKREQPERAENEAQRAAKIADQKNQNSHPKVSQLQKKSLRSPLRKQQASKTSCWT